MPLLRHPLVTCGSCICMMAFVGGGGREIVNVRWDVGQKECPALPLTISGCGLSSVRFKV